jgi:hypothetical protein
METSAEMLYLLKFADKEDKFGFKDELERNQCLQYVSRQDTSTWMDRDADNRH